MSTNATRPRNKLLTLLIGTTLWLTEPHPELTRPVDRQKARLTAAFALMLLAFYLADGLPAFQKNPARLPLLAILPVMISASAYFLARTRAVAPGGFLLLAGISAAGYWRVVAEGNNLLLSLLFYVPITLTIGSALLPGWAVLLLTGLNMATVLFILPALGSAAPPNLGSALGLVALFGLVVILLEFFRKNIEAQRLLEIRQANLELQEIRQNLELRVEERTREINRRSVQMEASTQVVRSAAAVHDLRELLETVVTQITERFGVYHVGIFLLDTAGKSLFLQAASSPGGRQLVKNGLRIEFSRQGIIGNAAYLKRPRLVQDVSTDPAFLQIPETSATRSELALPLLIRNRILGVLDLQSEKADAFKIEDVYTFQTMADQIALALDNTQLAEASQVALQQLEALNRATAGDAWKARLQDKTHRYLYTPLGLSPLGEKSSAPEESEKTIHVPLNLRGTSIGTLALKRGSSDPVWTAAEREMAEQVASQAALAIENARLLEDSLRRAQREQLVNEFSTRFSRSLDLDTLLQNAVRELQRLPQVSTAEIFLNPEKDTDQAQ
jgi:GAF domain-containing protein